MLRAALLRLSAINQRLRNPDESKLTYGLEEMRRTIAGEVVTYAQLAAMWQTAETAAAVEEYRMDHEGRLPPAVTALTPTYLETVPLDPFDGEPLRIRQFTNGYCVYSIGEIDVGGPYAENGKPRSNKMNEIKFVVERCLK